MAASKQRISLELYADAQQCCLENAAAWLRMADDILSYSSDPNAERRVSVLFAHGVCELGKAVHLCQAERTGERVVTVLSRTSVGHWISMAQEVVSGDVLSITPDVRDSENAGVDLEQRLSSFTVYTPWVPGPGSWLSTADVDSTRLRENLWAIQRQVTLAQAGGVALILRRPIEEFAPIPVQHRKYSENAVVRTALIIQERRPYKTRGPGHLTFTAAALEWIDDKQPLLAADVKQFARTWTHGGGTTRSELRKVVLRDLVQRYCPTLSSADQKEIAALGLGSKLSDHVGRGRSS